MFWILKKKHFFFKTLIYSNYTYIYFLFLCRLILVAWIVKPETRHFSWVNSTTVWFKHSKNGALLLQCVRKRVLRGVQLEETHDCPQPYRDIQVPSVWQRISSQSVTQTTFTDTHWWKAICLWGVSKIFHGKILSECSCTDSYWRETF